MANGEVLPNPVHPPGMTQLPTGFCHGISTSAGRNAALHVLTIRLQAKRDDQKVPLPQLNMQCLWPEASWPGLEQIHGPGHARSVSHRVNLTHVCIITVLWSS